MRSVSPSRGSQLKTKRRDTLDLMKGEGSLEGNCVFRKTSELKNKVDEAKGKLDSLNSLVNNQVNISTLQVKQEQKKKMQSQDLKINNEVLILKQDGQKDSKKPYIITSSYYQPEQVLIISLIDCESKIFQLSQNKKDLLVVEE